MRPGPPPPAQRRLPPRTYVAASEAVAVDLRDRHDIRADAVDVVHESIPVSDARYLHSRENAGRLRSGLGIEPIAGLLAPATLCGWDGRERKTTNVS